jgi:hypothetical protein
VKAITLAPVLVGLMDVIAILVGFNASRFPTVIENGVVVAAPLITSSLEAITCAVLSKVRQPRTIIAIRLSSLL